MKVFYTASYAFRTQNKKNYEETVKLIKSKFGENNIFYAHDEIDITFSNDNAGQKDILAATKYRQNALKDSDIVIADVTKGSAGIGYNISSAVSLKKPVLVLRERTEDKTLVHHPIDSANIRHLKYKEYESVKDLDPILDTFIKDSKDLMDSKFILIIPSEIDRYLEWASDYKRMHKAQLVREAIENFMHRDREWKEFMSEEE